MFKKFFIYNTPIMMASVALLVAVVAAGFIACMPEATAAQEEQSDAMEMITPPDLSGSRLIVEDINGDDLYPGDSIILRLILINNGDRAVENIIAEITSDAVPLAFEDQSKFEYERLEPDETATLELRAEVPDGIGEDIYGHINLDLYVEGNSMFELSEDLAVLGVAEYKRGLIPIIGLHAIEDEIEIPIELSTANFDILCSTLKDFDYQTITFDDLLKHIEHGRALPEKAVIITSDDGYQDNYTDAFPVLKKYGYIMTVFLVTGVIGEDDSSRMLNTVFNKRTDVSRPMLIWPEIQEMDQYGCEFLSHTENHVRLGLAADEVVLDELITSREALESRLGKDVDFFAWPYDNYSEAKWPLIEKAGYRGAVRYWGGIEDIRTIDLNNIKRVEFNSYIPPYQYAGYLKLFDLGIESNIQELEFSPGEELELAYVIKNNENIDIDITSFELELSDNLELIDVSEGSDISQFPGLSEGIFMWVGKGYMVEAGKEVSLGVLLKAVEAGDAWIKFRVTAFDSYVEAEDISGTITVN